MKPMRRRGARRRRRRWRRMIMAAAVRQRRQPSSSSQKPLGDFGHVISVLSVSLRVSAGIFGLYRTFTVSTEFNAESLSKNLRNTPWHHSDHRDFYVRILDWWRSPIYRFMVLSFNRLAPLYFMTTRISLLIGWNCVFSRLSFILFAAVFDRYDFPGFFKGISLFRRTCNAIKRFYWIPPDSSNLFNF